MTSIASARSTSAPSSTSGASTGRKSGESASQTTPTKRRRESTWDKAFRFLVEGKVRVTFVSESGYLVHATVEGDHGTYFVDHGLTRENRWTCSCPAYSADCSHARAVQRVTT